MKQSLFLKKCSKFCYVLFAVCGCLACTQNQKIEWPQVTNETKPWTRWWWEGNAVRTIDLDTVMRKYQEANLGGLEITPIYGIHGYEDRFKYNPKNEKTILEKRKRKVRPGRRKNENGKFPDTHTKKRQRLNVNKTVFKRCFFMRKNTQKVIVNSEKICIFT